MPTPQRTVVSDGFLKDRLTLIQTYLEAEATLIGLYKNTAALTSASVVGDLVEPDHGEYARVVATGNWQGPVKDEPGAHRLIQPVAVFQPPTSGDDQVCYGWFVLRDGALLFSTPFESTQTLTVGGQPIRVQIAFGLYSGALHAERVCV